MIKPLPSSKEEKAIIEALIVAAGKEPGLPHWLFVHELQVLLDKLEPDNVVIVNRVGNLSIYQASPAEKLDEEDVLIAVINFLWGEIDRYDEEEE